MKDIYSEIEYNGKKYKLVFDFNVMEEIQNEYGSVENWGKECEPSKNGEPNIKAIKFGFAAMLNEGIDITNEENKTSEAMFTLKQVGRILTELGTENIVKALNESVVASTKSIQKNA